MDSPTPLVFDPAIDPCRNATGLDLDVTIGPPIGVAAWPDEVGAANGVVSGADPVVGSGKAYRADGAFGAPIADGTDGDLVATP